MNLTAALSILLSLQHNTDIFFKPVLLHDNCYAYVEPWTAECFLGPNDPNYSNLNDSEFFEAVNEYLLNQANKVIINSAPANYKIISCDTGHFGFINEQFGTTILIMSIENHNTQTGN